MANGPPSLILTGASGIVGRGLLAAGGDRLRVSAVCRLRVPYPPPPAAAGRRRANRVEARVG